MRSATLGAVCEFKPAKRLAKVNLSETDPVSFVPMNALGIHKMNLVPHEQRSLSEVIGSYTYFADGDVLLAKITPCFENGKLGVARGLTNGVGFGSSEFIVIRPSHEILPEYLYYFLEREEVRQTGAKVMTGAVGHKRVPQEFIESLEITLPSLEEQRRIVAVLDEAFAAITTATANAEKNLANARELFEALLRETLADADGEETSLGDAANIKVGFAFKSNGYTTQADSIRLVRGDNIVQGRFRWDDVKRWPGDKAAEYADYSLAVDDVLLAMDRTWVKAGLKFAVVGPEDVPSLLVQRVARLRTKKTTSSEYIALQIASAAFIEYVLGIQTGLGVPHISGKQIADFRFVLPDRAKQDEIVRRTKMAKESCEGLARSYESRLLQLAALKQSLLHRAFTGELTVAVATQNTSVANDNFAKPQGTAQIIAFAYRRHQMQGQQQTYGRVKAQKSLHLVESIGGIDLGRQPMKDAAGPNDFPHMLCAEEWAEAQGFFKFVPRASGNGYDFKKLANYDALWADTVAATERVATALEKAIDPIVPMVSLDAEVFATVHAAWNNLIRDDVAITDDTIVKAARDDWHSAKLKIPEHKFREAIRTIKAKGMEPDGRAKYVGGQVKLI
ncbi:restriction endonuclease subunit S [Sphingopyxis sp.]|uniref:restriction endonuclease subunit S n=1 Tax=Sphingopyxis sp. TaxID=1908224 RepID=UPI003D125ABC